MKKYSGFTLIEMLIVMGIIIILMSAGIAGGRFALQRANRIKKQSAVENIIQALWGFYSDNRRFPHGTDNQTPLQMFASGATPGSLTEYMDAGQFDGGSDGTFWYFVSGTAQEMLVCASLGGLRDIGGLGIWCDGNGFGAGITSWEGATLGAITQNLFEPGDTYYDEIRTNGTRASSWDGEARAWSAY